MPDNSPKKHENALFFHRWIKAPRQLGTFAPISQKLARSAARLTHHPACLKVLELGAGTGRLTRALLKNGVKPENLTVVELDDSFCHFLKTSIPKIKVIQGNACELDSFIPPKTLFDVVYSVIPLTYLPYETRHKILKQALTVLKPKGNFYHVCYNPLSPFRKTPSIKANRLVSSWFNLPPGFVWEFDCDISSL